MKNKKLTACKDCKHLNRDESLIDTATGVMWYDRKCNKYKSKPAFDAYKGTFGESQPTFCREHNVDGNCEGFEK